MPFFRMMIQYESPYLTEDSVDFSLTLKSWGEGASSVERERKQKKNFTESLNSLSWKGP